jgi:hypothetical protein
MYRSRARRKPATVVVFAMLVLTLTWPVPAATGARCPLAWKRPADDLLTKGGPPSLCKAVNLIAANLSNDSGLMCDQIRGAQTAETTNLPATPNCAK